MTRRRSAIAEQAGVIVAALDRLPKTVAHGERAAGAAWLASGGRIVDVDHIVEHRDVGPTEAGNGQGLGKLAYLLEDHSAIHVLALPPILVGDGLDHLRTQAPVGLIGVEVGMARSRVEPFERIRRENRRVAELSIRELADKDGVHRRTVRPVQAAWPDHIRRWFVRARTQLDALAPGRVARQGLGPRGRGRAAAAWPRLGTGRFCGDPSKCLHPDDRWYRHRDPRFPFRWDSPAQAPGRWHAADDAPASYLADTPDGAWAGFLRHEEITDLEDLAGCLDDCGRPRCPARTTR